METEMVLTPHERMRLDQWLAMVSDRLSAITGDDLATIGARLESAGRMRAESLVHSLAVRWQSGCAAVRACRLVLAMLADPECATD